MGRADQRRRAIFGLAGLALLCLGLAALGDLARDGLAYRRALVAEGEVFRLLTAHLVHLNPRHAGMNVLGLALIGAVLYEVLTPGALAFVGVLSGLVIGIGLFLAWPEVWGYVGMSGVLHGWFAWGGLRLVAVRPWFGGVVLGGLGVKLAWETAVGPTPGASGAIGGTILLASHLLGAAGGALAFLLRRMLPVALILLWIPEPGSAHAPEGTVATVGIDAEDRLVVTIETHLTAFFLREPLGVLSPAARTRLAGLSDADLQDYIDGGGAYILAGTRLTAGGTAYSPNRLRVPSVAQVRAAGLSTDPHTDAIPLVLVFDAPVTRDAALTLTLPPLLGPVQLAVTVWGPLASVQTLAPGAVSAPFEVSGPPVFLTRALRALEDGALHVVPFGWDHALFVGALALALPLFWPVLVQASVFTLAHSVTLAAVALGVIQLPPLGVEIAIAASIALIGFANVHGFRGASQPALTRARLGVIFGFGLLHGIGFAGAFAALGRDGLWVPLIFFNLGVELGQIAVILVLLTVFALLPRAARRPVQIGGSAAIGLIGLYWTVERAATAL